MVMDFKIQLGPILKTHTTGFLIFNTQVMEHGNVAEGM